MLLTTSSCVVACMIGSLLKFSQNSHVVFLFIFLIFCLSTPVSGSVSEVSSTMSLWSNMYGPAIVLVHLLL